MNILFLSRWFPFPVNNGSKLRIYNLLKGLARHHDVTLLSFADDTNVALDSFEIRSMCSELHVVPWREFDPHSRRARIGFLDQKPRFLLDTYSERMESLIRNALSLKSYDFIIASQLSMASYYPCFNGVPALFEEIELGLFYDNAANSKSIFKRFRRGLTWFKLQRYLSSLLKSFHVCSVVSEQERQLLVSIFPDQKEKVVVLPNCVNFDDYQELSITPKPNQLIFSGPFHYRTNYEAMQWFIGEVFPKIIDQLPDTCLVITGDHADLPLPPAPNIALAGYVDDIKSLVASSRVSIAPLLSGGGTRLKILEAMAAGTPVVATSKGAEGLNALSGKHLLVADSPDDFASHIVALLKNENLYNKLFVNGKHFVKENYNWQSVMPHFLQLVERSGYGKSTV